jgi:hypothetical protein
VFVLGSEAAFPIVNYNQANDNTILNKSRSIKVDPYAADQDNSRIVAYCVNSRIGTVVLKPGEKPLVITFDSSINLYAIIDLVRH